MAALCFFPAHFFKPSRLAFSTVVALGLAIPMAAPRFAPAQAQSSSADGDNLPQPYEGKLKSAALVFSGAGVQYYPTTKLKEGQTVVAVGIKSDYLKILPPDGSFSYVAKAFVDRYGSGNKGKVNHEALVKAGSDLQSLKHAVQTKLEPNDDVTILGEEDEYLKIKPPKGAYLYVKKESVEPVGPVTRVEQPAEPIAATPAPTTGPSEAETVTVLPTTRDSLAAAPTSRPAEAAMVLDLQTLETQFAEASKQPLTEQPIDELLANYEKLSATAGVPEMVKRIADVRIATLKVRSEAKASFATLQKQQQESQDRLTSQRAEKDEIEQRIKEIDIQVYAAVGTLRASSLQVAKTQLYRLTDPQTGRTVVYVWGTDAKVRQHVGQFVGIKGPMQTDPRLNLKVINPTTVDQVDQNKVNNSIAAEIVPPSLLPKAPMANTAP